MAGSWAVTLASSSTTPMTPVEASITSRWRQPSSFAAEAAVRRAASAPALPVKALAHPALTTRARASPPPLPSWARHQSTGAEPTACWVNTPAQVVPSAKRMSSTSSRTCLYIPAWATESSTPATGAISGNATASGETCELTWRVSLV